jgi:hypothetical protein
MSMSMSLDGFIIGPDDDENDPLGHGGQRLRAWLANGHGDPGTYRPVDRSAGLLDEMEIQLVPVLLGAGRASSITWDTSTSSCSSSGSSTCPASHLRYQVQRPATR